MCDTTKMLMDNPNWPLIRTLSSYGFEVCSAVFSRADAEHIAGRKLTHDEWDCILEDWAFEIGLRHNLVLDVFINVVHRNTDA